jgi:hypothetical protein
LQNPVFTVELLLQEAGLGVAISGRMRVIKTNIGRPEWMLRNALDYCNGENRVAMKIVKIGTTRDHG